LSDSRTDELRKEVERHEIAMSDETLGTLAEYLDLLWTWNEKLNLTRHDTVEKFVTLDLIDVLELSKLIPPDAEVLDMGTGGGVPGIPLAILRPDLEVSLCESVGKKAKAVDDIVSQLGLPIPVHASRVEDVLEDCRYDYVVARAVGSLWKICTWLKPHWPMIHGLLAIKGPKWVDERKEARHRGVMQGLHLRKVAEYRSLGDDPRYSVILRVNHDVREK
jgi:16S rRNA (guanine527-N7)-methyltransferase